MLARKTLSIYVDESGNFGDVGDPARYCMVTLVFHDDGTDISSYVREYRNGVFNAGADPESMSFHTAPLIRQEDQFAAMNRHTRGRIFYQMLSLARKCDVRYKSFWVDTKFVSSDLQIVNTLRGQIEEFVATHRELFSSVESVDLYYDAGQKGVTRILEALVSSCPCPVRVVQGAIQKDYLLLQVADFLCTLKLIALRADVGIPFNSSEKKFFGSARDFKRNVLRKIAGKELV